MKKNLLISPATRKNWIRLDITENDTENKLKSRANKTQSEKQIIPNEYFCNKENIKLLNKILSLNCDVLDVVYSLAINLLLKNDLIQYQNGEIFSDNIYIFETLMQYSDISIKKELLFIDLPQDENDFIGLVYQALSLEGAKNVKGSYYTPQQVIEKCFNNIESISTFLDPCCGSGSFLIHASKYIKNPENIYGFDTDAIACFIAKINLFIKYKNIKFKPNIFNTNFLDYNFGDKNFDLIATNPPWGACGVSDYKKLFPQITSSESFSLFILKSAQLIKNSSNLVFVLPESVLNVKTHRDIRIFILENFHIKSIEVLGKIFSGVMSNVILLSLDKNTNKNEVKIINNTISTIPQKFYNKNTNNNFSVLKSKDVEIINKIYSQKYKTLDEKSIWALGIVTGNNAKFISTQKASSEKIYSGKNIQKGAISETERYIIYQRKNFQQVAADEIYRADEKLVYRFISKNLIFAYDNKQRLFLNSANILIPKLEGYSIKQVMAFLNSTLFQYIYQKTIGELKILKGNLMKLPFPDVKFYIKEEISDDEIFKIFKLTPSEISYIKQEVK